MKNQVGKENKANNGQKMTIINYRGADSLDVQFEDGTIVYNKSYASFERGSIRNPNIVNIVGKGIKRIGETRLANNGQRMTIVAYRRSDDIDVQFEDGTLVTGREYQNFKNGEIWNPNCPTVRVKKKNCIGETKVSNFGEKMTIIDYRKYDDLDVQFEDGTIVTGKGYGSFKNGSIENPMARQRVKDAHVGEVVQAKNGQKMTLMAYHSTRNVDIQFEDGTMVYGVRYRYFKMGSIANPNFKKKKK